MSVCLISVSLGKCELSPDSWGEKKGCLLRGSAPRAHVLCELGLSLPVCRAIWVASCGIREGHRRKAMTGLCMSSSHCLHWRAWLLFKENHMEGSPPH